jgi:hypothetical protein
VNILAIVVHPCSCATALFAVPARGPFDAGISAVIIDILILHSDAQILFDDNQEGI